LSALQTVHRELCHYTIQRASRLWFHPWRLTKRERIEEPRRRITEEEDAAAFVNESFRSTGGTANEYALHHFMEFRVNEETERELQGLRLALFETMAGMVARPSILLRCIPGEDSNERRAVLIVKARSHSFSDTDLQSDTAILGDALHSVGILPQITLHVAGELNDALTKEATRDIANQALNAVHAQSVERMECDDCLSVSAHAKKGPRHIWTGASPMNLQVAVHVDRLRSITNVLVGTPIILDSY
jgi:hypothetical protein